MRIALITDIHEDYHSLKRAFRAIERSGYDIVVCLGDITGFSPLFYHHKPDANACVELLREKADVVIAGNHDLYTSGRLPTYHHKKNIPANWYDLSVADRIRLSRNKIWLYLDEIVPGMDPENLHYLFSLPEWHVLEYNQTRLLFSHFFQPDMAGIARWFPFNSLEIRDHFRFMKENGCTLSFVGHSHPPGPVTVNRLFWSHPQDETISIKKHHKAVICPAVVSGRHPGAVSLFDMDNQVLTPIMIH